MSKVKQYSSATLCKFCVFKTFKPLNFPQRQLTNWVKKAPLSANICLQADIWLLNCWMVNMKFRLPCYHLKFMYYTVYTKSQNPSQLFTAIILFQSFWLLDLDSSDEDLHSPNIESWVDCVKMQELRYAVWVNSHMWVVLSCMSCFHLYWYYSSHPHWLFLKRMVTFRAPVRARKKYAYIKPTQKVFLFSGTV